MTVTVFQAMEAKFADDLFFALEQLFLGKKKKTLWHAYTSLFLSANFGYVVGKFRLAMGANILQGRSVPLRGVAKIIHLCGIFKI